MMKKFYSLFIALVFISSAFAQKNIIYVCITDITGETATETEQPTIDALTAYTVTLQQVSYLVADNLSALNAADFIIVGRSCNSGEVIPTFDLLSQVTTPILYMSPYVARGDRGGLVAATGSANYVTGSESPIQAVITAEAAASPVFEGISEGTIEWWTGMYSLFDAEGTTTTNASLKVKTPNDEVLLVMYDANVLMDGSAARTSQGSRAYMGNGQDNTEPANYFTFTDNAKQVFLNLIAFMADSEPAAVNDLTIKAINLSVYAANGEISFSMNDLSRVEIYSLDGKLQLKSIANGNSLKLNSDLQNGIYIARGFAKNGQSAAAKFMVR